jgi:hypothetical protein
VITVGAGYAMKGYQIIMKDIMFTIGLVQVLVHTLIIAEEVSITIDLIL